MRRYNSLNEKIEVRNEHLGGYSGQDDFNLILNDTSLGDDNYLGHINYTEFQGEIYINMVKVDPAHRRKRWGERLIDELVKLYSYADIRWGVMSGDGTKLKKKMDRKYA